MVRVTSASALLNRRLAETRRLAELRGGASASFRGEAGTAARLHHPSRITQPLYGLRRPTPRQIPQPHAPTSRRPPTSSKSLTAKTPHPHTHTVAPPPEVRPDDPPGSCIYAPRVGAQDDLWAELSYLFDTDDGSLPEVVFTGAEPGEVQSLFAFLIDRGTIDAESKLWDNVLDAGVPVIDVPDAGARVVIGQAEAFHVLLDGIEVDGVALPPIGAFILTDEVALDYRMGPAWTPPVLAALARLLGAMRTLAPSATLQARPDGAPDCTDPRFVPALDRYLASPDVSPPRS